MLQWFANLAVRKRVGILAMILGIIAIFLGDPYNRAEAKVNLKEIAMLTPSQIDKVSVYTLADWIIKGNADYRLLDLRGMEAFKKYNIPTSEPVAPPEVIDGDFMRNEKLILCADDDLTEAKTWFMLKAEHYKSVYILDGGINAWRDKILFPALPAGADKEQKARFAKISAVSKFFGGQPQTGSVARRTHKELPKLTAPKTVLLKRSHKKKKREGC